VSPRTPEAPPLSKVLDAAERRPTLIPCDCAGARRGELWLAAIASAIGTAIVLGAGTVLLAGGVAEDGGPPEARLVVPIEKCIRMRGGR
jgi:hypothetical protein